MHPYFREYFKIMRGRRGDCCCKKCGWFGHMAYQCRKKEIVKKGERSWHVGATDLPSCKVKFVEEWRGNMWCAPSREKHSKRDARDVGSKGTQSGVALTE